MEEMEGMREVQAEQADGVLDVISTLASRQA
jgi:hypothetical protein